MNQELHNILSIIQEIEALTPEQKQSVEEWIKRIDNSISITESKLQTLNRELEIEAALERVRSRTMSMHQTSELQEVIHIVHKELIHLNLSIDGGSFVMINEDVDPEFRCWGSGGTANTSQELHVPHFDLPFCTNLMKGVKRGPGFFTEEFSREEKIEYFTKLFKHKPWSELSDEQKNETLSSEGGYTRSVVVSKHTTIFIINHVGRKFTETENDVLKRFGRVFDQTYTRFLDLQNAEAQAREAQIEAALERIRATTMAMHKSDELLQTSQVLFDQFKLLGEHADQLTIGMINESEGVVEIYATVQGEPLPTVFRHSISDPYVMSKVFRVWKAGEKSLILELTANELELYNRFRNELVGKQVFTTHVAPEEKRVIYCSYFSKGMLAFGDNVQPRPETRELLDRFSKVFDQTYTRFLDLQKAEEQAIRAEKDLIEIKAARKKAEEALVELQATQQQLIQSEKMASLGELTAGIAHEIQNPLNFVNNFSELNRELLAELKEELGTGNFASAEQLAEDIEGNEEKINFHGKRADSIVKSMLQHSKVSTGTKEPTDINALAEEFLRLSFHGFRAKDKSFNATVNTTFDESIGKVEVMPQDIGRVLLNLFNNSFYAVNEKKKKTREVYEPVVQVITVKTPSGIEIKVKDNGVGIPEKLLNKIYQPFFTTKPTGEGTGLGLSLSYDIITKGHGGDMKVHTKEGEGSTFIVELPS